MTNKIANKEFQILDKMYKDYLSGPEVYHASKFWEKLNRLNIEWLKSDGLENFKRTVNNNYFNWMVNIKSEYFQNVSKPYLKNILFKPSKLWKLISTNIGEMDHRTYVSKNTNASFFEKKIYSLYLLFLYEYVKNNDEFGIYKDVVEEPHIGNPIIIKKDGKAISQDISNSYLEYSYVRKTFKENFSDVRIIGEIGGGYGRLSYLFRLLHEKDDKKIVLIDLPPALFLSQWYLKQMFPETKMFNYTNFNNFSDIEEEFFSSEICFFLPHQLELLPDKIFDLLINVSSLHEMSRNQINHYYDLIDKKASNFYTKQWVFWENPEDKINVPAVIYPTKPEWDLLDARLNPVHSKFFEAVFRLN